ncbi:hypothetical protein GGF31_002748 [Allomyces arbusculus]|nr:hypothetical protein GGF31_002748 [Allomyces arbusculus]
MDPPATPAAAANSPSVAPTPPAPNAVPTVPMPAAPAPAPTSAVDLVGTDLQAAHAAASLAAMIHHHAAATTAAAAQAAAAQAAALAHPNGTPAPAPAAAAATGTPAPGTPDVAHHHGLATPAHVAHALQQYGGSPEDPAAAAAARAMAAAAGASESATARLTRLEASIDLAALASNAQVQDYDRLRTLFRDTVYGVNDIVAEKLYKARGMSLEEFFRVKFKISRAQVYRVVDSAAVIRDLEALTGHAALEGRPVPLPIKQRVCATIKSLAHSRRDRQELWMAVCAKTAPMQVTSKEVKETWDRLLAQGRVGAHAMHRPGAGHDDDDEISHQHPVGMVAGMLSTTIAASEEAAAAAAAAAALAGEAGDGADGASVRATPSRVRRGSRSGGPSNAASVAAARRYRALTDASATSLDMYGSSASSAAGSPFAAGYAHEPLQHPRWPNTPSAGGNGGTPTPFSGPVPPPLLYGRNTPPLSAHGSPALGAAADAAQAELIQNTIAALQKLLDAGIHLEPYIDGQWMPGVTKWRFYKENAGDLMAPAGMPGPGGAPHVPVPGTGPAGVGMVPSMTAAIAAAAAAAAAAAGVPPPPGMVPVQGMVSVPANGIVPMPAANDVSVPQVAAAEVVPLPSTATPVAAPAPDLAPAAPMDVDTAVPAATAPAPTTETVAEPAAAAEPVTTSALKRLLDDSGDAGELAPAVKRARGDGADAAGALEGASPAGVPANAVEMVRGDASATADATAA